MNKEEFIKNYLYNQAHDNCIVELKNSTKEKVMNFIKERLTITDEELTFYTKLASGCTTISDNRLRFEMSGYETLTGKCTVWNQAVLNRFADLGIYDYTKYLFLDFAKGHGELYLEYYYESTPLLIDDLGGVGTREIIYEVFLNTIFSDKPKRQRT
jgi:hypothetical protein